MNAFRTRSLYTLHLISTVRTGDADVVLAVMIMQKIPPKDEVWLAFGTGMSF